MKQARYLLAVISAVIMMQTTAVAAPLQGLEVRQLSGKEILRLWPALESHKLYGDSVFLGRLQITGVQKGTPSEALSDYVGSLIWGVNREGCVSIDVLKYHLEYPQDYPTNPHAVFALFPPQRGESLPAQIKITMNLPPSDCKPVRPRVVYVEDVEESEPAGRQAPDDFRKLEESLRRIGEPTVSSGSIPGIVFATELCSEIEKSLQQATQKYLGTRIHLVGDIEEYENRGMAAKVRVGLKTDSRVRIDIWFTGEDYFEAMSYEMGRGGKISLNAVVSDISPAAVKLRDYKISGASGPKERGRR